MELISALQLRGRPGSLPTRSPRSQAAPSSPLTVPQLDGLLGLCARDLHAGR